MQISETSFSFDQYQTFSSFEEYKTPSTQESFLRLRTRPHLTIPRNPYLSQLVPKQIHRNKSADLKTINELQEEKEIDLVTRASSFDNIISPANKIEQIRKNWFGCESKSALHPLEKKECLSPLTPFELIQKGFNDVQRSKTLLETTKEKEQYVANRLRQECSVMIVDDEPFVRMVVSDVFQNIQPDVNMLEVQSGGDCLKQFEALLPIFSTTHFLFIVMDYSMPPGINGLETIQKIREQELRHNFQKDPCTILILAHTAEDRSIQQAMVNAGANAILPKKSGKPVLVEVLYQLIFDQEVEDFSPYAQQRRIISSSFD